MTGCIYILENTINSKVYIGQTKVSLRSRIRDHFKPTAKDTNIARAIKKYGKDAFKYRILTNVESSDIEEFKQFLDKAEIFFIRMYESNNPMYGYNLTKGGKTCECSLETRIKISQSKMGPKNPNYGKKPSPLTIQKRLITMKLRGTGKMSEENKLKASERMKGPNNPNYNPDRVYKAKRGYNAKGPRNNMYGKSGLRSPVIKPVNQYDKQGNFIKDYISATEAGKQLGISQKNISCCCTGRLKSAGGFVWRHK